MTLQLKDGDLEVAIDHAATRRTRRRAQAQLDALNAGGPDGRIDV